MHFCERETNKGENRRKDFHASVARREHVLEKGADAHEDLGETPQVQQHGEPAERAIMTPRQHLCQRNPVHRQQCCVNDCHHAPRTPPSPACHRACVKNQKQTRIRMESNFKPVPRVGVARSAFLMLCVLCVFWWCEMGWNMGMCVSLLDDVSHIASWYGLHSGNLVQRHQVHLSGAVQWLCGHEAWVHNNDLSCRGCCACLLLAHQHNHQHHNPCNHKCAHNANDCIQYRAFPCRLCVGFQGKQ